MCAGQFWDLDCKCSGNVRQKRAGRSKEREQGMSAGQIWELDCESSGTR